MSSDRLRRESNRGGALHLQVMRRGGSILVGVLVLVLGVVVAFKFRDAVTDGLMPERDPVPVSSADLSGTGNGSLFSAMTMPNVTSGIARKGRAARVVYRSTEGDTNTPTVVSGAVFVPAGIPPTDGWPVVAIGHGTTGINEPCAPSLSKDLMGQSAVVENALTLGYAVAVPDYQGLGVPGVHPYLDSRTAGRNVIDAVRALRSTFPGISTRWGAYGASQGGAAVWSANEQAATYAPELSLVGVVAAAPAADITGIVQKAQEGTMSLDQTPLFQWLLESLSRLHPAFDVDAFRHGNAAKLWDVLSGCSDQDIEIRNRARRELGPNDLSPATPEAAQHLRELLTQWALPQTRLSAPLAVVYGDVDTYVDWRWTAAAIDRACHLGGTVVPRLEVGKGHLDLDISAQVEWLNGLFAGADAVNGCP